MEILLHGRYQAFCRPINSLPNAVGCVFHRLHRPQTLRHPPPLFQTENTSVNTASDTCPHNGHSVPLYTPDMLKPRTAAGCRRVSPSAMSGKPAGESGCKHTSWAFLLKFPSFFPRIRFLFRYPSFVSWFRLTSRREYDDDDYL